MTNILPKSDGSALDNLLAPIHSEKPTVLPVLEASELNFSQALDDLNNRMSHFYYSRQSNLSEEELSPLGEHYGFKIHPASSKSYGWPEDNLWLSRDGKLAFQPKTPLENKEQYNQFVTALKDKGIPNSEEEGLHSLGIKDSQGLPQRKLDQAKHFLASFNKRMVKTFSIIDGGNMLTGLRENGNPYVLVGRDAVLQTTLVHGGFAQQGQPRLSFYDEVRVNEKLKELPEDVDAINRMTTMLQAGEYISNSLSPEEARDQAKRFLAMNEITQDIMAAELKVPREDLVIISQPDFHIDMHLRPLVNGRVLVNDYEESKNLVERVLRDKSNGLLDQTRVDVRQIIGLQEIIGKFEELPQHYEKIRELDKNIVNDEFNRVIDQTITDLQGLPDQLKKSFKSYEKLKLFIGSFIKKETKELTKNALKKILDGLNDSYKTVEKAKKIIESVLTDSLVNRESFRLPIQGTKIFENIRDQLKNLSENDRNLEQILVNEYPSPSHSTNPDFSRIDENITELCEYNEKIKYLVNHLERAFLEISDLQQMIEKIDDLPQHYEKFKELLVNIIHEDADEFMDQTETDCEQLINTLQELHQNYKQSRNQVEGVLKNISSGFTDQNITELKQSYHKNKNLVESVRDTLLKIVDLQKILGNLNELPQPDDKNKELVGSTLDYSTINFTEQNTMNLKKTLNDIDGLHSSLEKSKEIRERILNKKYKELNNQMKAALQQTLDNISGFEESNEEIAELVESILNDNSDELNDIKNFISNNELFHDEFIRIVNNVAADNQSILALKQTINDIYDVNINNNKTYQEIKELLNSVLNNRQIRIDWKKSLTDLENLHQERSSINSLIEKQLHNKKLQVIKAPGVFSIGNREVNYMNGLMGASPKDEKFYITNASSIEPLNRAFSEWIKKQQSELQVEFIGSKNRGKNNGALNTAEQLLKKRGGFDCVTLHHGEGSQPTGIRAETADSVLDLRVPINKENQVDRQSLSAKQLVSLKGNPLLVDAMATFSSNHLGTHSIDNAINENVLVRQSPLGKERVPDTLSRHQYSAGTL
jgi:hypothetical protein